MKQKVAGSGFRVLGTDVLLSLILISTLSGCVTAKDMAALIEAGGKDNATLCAALVGGVAGMTIAPGAAMPIIPGAGYYGKGAFCRTNQPGTTIEQGMDGSLKITQGAPAVSKDTNDRLDTLETAVKYLLQKLLDAKGLASSTNDSGLSAQGTLPLARASQP